MASNLLQLLFFGGQVMALALLVYGAWLCFTAGRARPLILVVDDDPSMRALVRLHLAGGGWEVLEAGDGVAGRYLVMTALPDLVICDVHMPRMTGLELLADLKAHPLTRDVPVVLLTADEDLGALARAAGAADCLRKPVAARQLLDVTDSFVSRLT